MSRGRHRQPRRRATSRRIMRAFGHQALARLVTTLLALVYVGISSRYLGPSAYGSVTAALAVASLCTGLSDFGVNAVALREGGSDAELLRKIVSGSVGLSIAYAVPLALLASAVGGLVYGWNPGSTGRLVAVTAPYIVAYTVSACYIPIFQFHHDFRGSLVGDVLSSLITLGAAVLAVRCGWPSWTFVVTVGVAACAKLIVVYASARRLEHTPPNWDVHAWAKILKAAVPIGASALVGTLYFRADAIILSVVSTGEETGLYALCYRVIGALGAVPNLAVSSSFASLSEAAKSSDGMFVRRVSKLMNLLCFGAFALWASVGPFSQYILRTFGGADYASGASALLLMVAATSFSFVNTGLSVSLILGGRERILFVSSVGFLILNVVGNVGLDRSHGAGGAGLSLLLSEAGSTIVAGLVLLRRLRVRLANRTLVVQILFGCLLVYAVMVGRRYGPLVSVAVSTVLLCGSVLGYRAGSRRYAAGGGSAQVSVDAG